MFTTAFWRSPQGSRNRIQFSKAIQKVWLGEAAAGSTECVGVWAWVCMGSCLCLLESRLWVSMYTTNKHTWLLSDVWDCCSSGLHGSCQQSSNATTLISNIEQSISSYPPKTKEQIFSEVGFFFNWDEAFPTPDVWSWIWSISQQQGLVKRNSEFKKKFTIKCFQLYQYVLKA